jgi:hypothetical protein
MWSMQTENLRHIEGNAEYLIRNLKKTVDTIVWNTDSVFKYITKNK